MTQLQPPGDPTTVASPPSTDPGARVIDLADADWCWSRLRSTTVGVLSSRSARRPVSLDVSYTLLDQQLFVPVGSDHELVRLLDGGEVTLALSGRGDDGQRWVVRVTGVAVLLHAPPGSALLDDHRSNHRAHGVAPPGATSTLRLPVDRIRGYHETPLDPEDGPR